MQLQRLQIEQDGFLAGLDVTFAPGLNVIIGARGTGKTSIIELLRYTLGVGGFTQDAQERGTQQAVAILQGGAASVSFEAGGDQTIFTRSASGFLANIGTGRPRCTVLAQNEIEAVGAQRTGRLHLVDRFRKDVPTQAARAARIESELESLTTQIQDILAEGAGLAQQVLELKRLEADLDEARAAQQQLLLQAQATDQDRRDLARLEEASKRVAARGATISENLTEITATSQQLERIQQQSWFDRDLTPSASSEDIQAALTFVREAYNHIGRAQSALDRASTELRRVSSADARRRNEIDEQGRTLRQALNTVQSGVGQASRRVQELEERLGQLTALTERLQERRRRFLDIASDRNRLYEELDSLRERIFEERVEVSESLNTALGPQIRTTILHSSNTESYQSALISSLRGSGLHYNSLAPNIARAVSPIELANWIERGDFPLLANALNLSNDRAYALGNALRSNGLAEIVASAIEDDVVLELLDGKEYKTTDRLSIGQRCTVILPLLLGQHGDALLIDQPEDHLDNAFIVSTLVTALKKRRPDDQMILTSHNANIPVLGEADRVIVLGSDGDRGYVSVAGDLDDPAIVDAVSRIMEGGREAFAARSAFYSKKRVLGG